MATTNEVSANAVKSLLELSLNVALKQMLHPDFKDSDFDSLEPRLQRLLFSKLRDATIHLQAFKKQITSNCPDTDAKLYQSPRKIKKYEDEDSREMNGFVQQSKFQREWSYEAIPSQRIGLDNPERIDVEWNCDDLVSDSPSSAIRELKKGERYIALDEDGKG